VRLRTKKLPEAFTVEAPREACMVIKIKNPFHYACLRAKIAGGKQEGFK